MELASGSTHSRNNPEAVQQRQACALEVCAGGSSRRGPGAGGRRGARCQRNLCERTVQADICGVAKVRQLGDQPLPGEVFECEHPLVRPPPVPTDLERLYLNMSRLLRPPGPPLPLLLFCTASREAGFQIDDHDLIKEHIGIRLRACRGAANIHALELVTRWTITWKLGPLRLAPKQTKKCCLRSSWTI